MDFVVMLDTAQFNENCTAFSLQYLKIGFRRKMQNEKFLNLSIQNTLPMKVVLTRAIFNQRNICWFYDMVDLFLIIEVSHFLFKKQINKPLYETYINIHFPKVV